jgi:hypothetical protein
MTTIKNIWGNISFGNACRGTIRLQHRLKQLQKSILDEWSLDQDENGDWSRDLNSKVRRLESVASVISSLLHRVKISGRLAGDEKRPFGARVPCGLARNCEHRRTF